MRYIIVLLSFLIISCAEAPDFSEEPVIEFLSVSNNMIRQSTVKDTIFFMLHFEDGDGDIGSTEGSEPNVVMVDERDGSAAFTFRTPKIPEQGAGNGVEGEVILKAIINKGDLCCFFPNGQSPCTPSSVFRFDTIYYSTTLTDRAGNVSNEVMAGPVIIRCDDPN